MTAKRFRVNELFKYNYSEIGEYIDENHTDKPLRNDEVAELLNELHEENERLRKDSTVLILANQNYRKENEELKSFIKKLTSNDGKIWLMNGYVYKPDKILEGNVE